tara:strand:+ start:28720 stop:28938 length:219 start_codon:yes stop_codon:yes gene_type:complete
MKSQTSRIQVTRYKLGRPVAKELKQIIGPDQIDVGFGPGQLRPNGSRDIRAEEQQLSKIVQDINGMSGQQTG